MPQIRQYSAEERPLEPSDAGYTAFETAGRRIGPAYNEAAEAYREIGRLQGEAIRDRAWPGNIAELWNSMTQQFARERETGYRLQEQQNEQVQRLEDERRIYRSPLGRSPYGSDELAGYQPSYYGSGNQGASDQVAAGAAALGDLMNALTGQSPPSISPNENTSQQNMPQTTTPSNWLNMPNAAPPAATPQQSPGYVEQILSGLENMFGSSSATPASIDTSVGDNLPVDAGMAAMGF